MAASYARFSCDLQREDSITDQQRKFREAAERNGHELLGEREYSDEAVSGTKRDRTGLNRLLADAEVGRFGVLYFYSLSWLARESVISMPILKRLVHTYGVRVISVTEGIDSAQQGWEMSATIASLFHERYVDELGRNVFRGQEGAVLAGYCVGDHCFGYTSEVVPGSESQRRSRSAKPRKTYAIDENEAEWVRKIFRWFVEERRTLRWIAQELNHLQAPKDHRASTREWRHGLVARLLANRKYIGIWPWGEAENCRDPESGKVHQERRPEEQVEKWTRELPALAIIDKSIFREAQRLLEANRQRTADWRRRNGTLKGGVPRSFQKHLLAGLIRCHNCGSRFHVGGAHGKYLFCPGYHRGTCTCQTQLRRERAERMILDRIGVEILANEAWLEAVFQRLAIEWQQFTSCVPSELLTLEKAIAELERKIERLLDSVENGASGPDFAKRLADRRAECRALVEKRAELCSAQDDRVEAPTKEWVSQQLQKLGEVLLGASPAAAGALRDLVGGAIVVQEIRSENRKRFHLQGRFRISHCSLADTLRSQATRPLGSSAEGTDDTEIVIDFVDPSSVGTDAALAMELYERGLLNKDIAQHLGWPRNKLTKALKHAFALRGEKALDGRARRHQLAHSEPALYQRVAEQVKTLWDTQMPVMQIARELACDLATVRKAITYWHTSRGLPVPDGRTRRKTLTRNKASGTE